VARIVFETGEVPEWYAEDGGCALITHVSEITEPESMKRQRRGRPNIRVISWDEHPGPQDTLDQAIHTKQLVADGKIGHPWMQPFRGKRLRVTVETIDETEGE
jgi:hypothetical protein